MTINTPRDAKWTGETEPDNIQFSRENTLTVSRFKYISHASRQRSAAQKASLPLVK